MWYTNPRKLPKSYSIEYQPEKNNTQVYYKTDKARNAKKFSLRHISTFKDDINYKDSGFVPPLKIRTQLKRLVNYNSKDPHYKTKEFISAERLKVSRSRYENILTNKI